VYQNEVFLTFLNICVNGQQRGYAVSIAAGSTLTITNTCVLGNDFIGEGVVLIAEQASLLNSSGNFGTQDDSLICEFIHALDVVNETICIDYESDTCLSRLDPRIPQTVPEKLPCYDNITVLVEHMDYKNPFTPETYILCPDTIFPIGSETNPGERCCIDNQSPILSQSNTEIKCGDDGDPKNNCVVTGGIFQVLFSYTNWAEVDENFVVEGVTFQEADFASVMLSNARDVTFRNCIFRVGLFFYIGT